jgi:hypothetical protein
MTHDDHAPQQHRPAPTPQRPAPAAKPTPPSQPPRTIPKRDASIADAETRKRMILQLQDIGEASWNYFVSKGMLKDNETLDQLPLEFVPTTKFQFMELRKAIEALDKAAADQIPGAEVQEPEMQEPEGEASSDDVNSPNAAWRSFPLPFPGKGGTVPRGTPLGELDGKYQFGLFKNVKAETEYNGQPMSPERIAASKAFREALNQMGAHKGFK